MEKQERIDQLEGAIAKLRGGLDATRPHFPHMECPHFKTCYTLSVINELEAVVDDLRRENGS